VDLNFGKVIEYSERGFGFIQTLLINEEPNQKVFFHISKVKECGIEPQLIELERGSPVNIPLWFTTEETVKGVSLDNCWVDENDIPKEYLVNLAKSFADILSSPEIHEEDNIPNTNSINEHTESEITKPILEPTIEVPSYHHLSLLQNSQIMEYIGIYKKESFTQHYEVNNYITVNKIWDRFSEIRSLNDHGESKNIPGILPKFYAIVCTILKITGANGAPLYKSEKY
jgi:cold shock CspA family protein